MIVVGAGYLGVSPSAHEDPRHVMGQEIAVAAISPSIDDRPRPRMMALTFSTVMRISLLINIAQYDKYQSTQMSVKRN